MKIIKSLSAALLLTVSISCSAATFDDNQKKEIEAIIDEYVSTHPEIIIKAMKKLENDEEARLLDERIIIANALRNDKGLPSKGKSSAKHYIINFYDYNCGYCKVMEPMFEQALKEYDLQVVYVNIPVIKESSKKLAIVGQSIYNIDSQKYFDYHDHFMSAGYPATDQNSLKALVKRIGVSWDKVVDEMKSNRPQKQIGKSLDDSMKLKIAGTPYLIVDGKEYRGAITSYEVLKTILDNQSMKFLILFVIILPILFIIGTTYSAIKEQNKFIEKKLPEILKERERVKEKAKKLKSK